MFSGQKIFCRDCKAYKADGGRDYGSCHFNPPQVVGKDTDANRWPLVNDDSFCLQFIPAEPAKIKMVRKKGK